RDHAAIARKEDEARGGDPEPQRLGENLGKSEAVDDRRRACEEQHQRTVSNQLGDPDTPASDGVDRWGGGGSCDAQAGRPERSSGQSSPAAASMQRSATPALLIPPNLVLLITRKSTAPTASAAPPTPTSRKNP